MLNNIKISKNETCLTYCFKRIDLAPDFCDYETIDEKFNKIRFDETVNLLVGDILLWDQKIEYTYMANEIIGNEIIWNMVAIKVHFAVYETNNLISDCTRHEHNPYPTIRLRKLSDINPKPAYVLRLKIVRL